MSVRCRPFPLSPIRWPPPRVRKVIGVEISPDAVKDAGINAEINDIANAEFFAGKAEKKLKHILRSIPSLPPKTEDTPAAVDDAAAVTAAEATANETAATTPAPSSGGSSDVVAIVDPPRPGLHKDCIKALLKCHALRKLVYVSCNPTKSLPDDIVALCQPSAQTDLQVRE